MYRSSEGLPRLDDVDNGFPRKKGLRFLKPGKKRFASLGSELIDRASEFFQESPLVFKYCPRIDKLLQRLLAFLSDSFLRL